MSKYISKTSAMAHQTESLARRALRPPGYDDVFVDSMEMGCGKTKVILDEWQEMVGHGYVSDLLVIAPAGCIRNWYANKSETQKSEIATHLDPKLLTSMVYAGWGNTTKARKACNALVRLTEFPRALFVNVEALSSGDKAYDLCVKFMKNSARGVMLVIDESTTIRNIKSKRTATIVCDIDRKGIDHALRPLAKVRRLASGLITPKSPMDLYWQYYFLDKRILGYEDFTTFRQRYAEVRRACYEPTAVIKSKFVSALGVDQKFLTAQVLQDRLQACLTATGSPRILPRGMKQPEILAEMYVLLDNFNRDQMVECILALGHWIANHVEVGEFKNLEELHEKIAPFTHRVLKKDCMDLPPKVYEFRETTLTDDQERMYEEMRRKCTAELEGQHVTAASVIAQMMRLHQIVLGHTRAENKELMTIKSRRVDAVMEVLAEHQGKAIIWSAYRPEVDALAARLIKEKGKNCYAMFHGGNKGTRHIDERRFLEEPECEYMLASQGAAGMGNTWINNSFSIYMCNNYNLEHRLQSEDRNHRRGQTGNCVTYVDIIVRGTVEEKIITALRDKIDLAAIITGEDYKQWLI